MCASIRALLLSQSRKKSPVHTSSPQLHTFFCSFLDLMSIWQLCSGSKALFYLVWSKIVLERLCTCRTLAPPGPPPPSSLKPKTLLNQDSPSPTSPSPGPPPASSSCLFLFLSLSLSYFLSVLWRQVALRMPGPIQNSSSMVRVTLSTKVQALLNNVTSVWAFCKNRGALLLLSLNHHKIEPECFVGGG